MEAHLTDSGIRKCSSEFSLLEPHICKHGPSSNSNEIHQSILQRTVASLHNDNSPGNNGKNSNVSLFNENSNASLAGASHLLNLDSGNILQTLSNLANATSTHVINNVTMDEEANQGNTIGNFPLRTAEGRGNNGATSLNNALGNAVNIAVSGGQVSGALNDCVMNEAVKTEFASDDQNNVLTHQTNQPYDGPVEDEAVRYRQSNSKVFKISFNPNKLVLAVSHRTSVSLYHVSGETSDFVADLPHLNCQNPAEVSFMEWNKRSNILATAGGDGWCRIWDDHGTLKDTLKEHSGSVRVVKWNSRGDLLLTAGQDKRAIVWDSETLTIKQQLEGHSGQILDAAWRNNEEFATSGDDSQICVWKIGEISPLAKITTTNTVSTLKWNPRGDLLASSSGNNNTEIWSVQTGYKCIFSFGDHEGPITVLLWSPTGSGTRNSTAYPFLATGSKDKSIKLWDLETGKVSATLRGHTTAGTSFQVEPTN
eukprot:CAMPEP_0115034812 /NCGR_PEP_ID=MMETSP0216-20121206/40944_1 /TAXON_ID=223996 /ORGANISM="Protocruzia adherens, Strain Boccale" /LENGTH=480 /DNA_ID=CAMNT_0002413909 /DNA_START=168 /DNA_END=1610 /DNA_ORIENTATION=-